MTRRSRHSSPAAITAAARQIAHTLKAGAIVTFTSSGSTTLRAAQERPDVPILCITPSLAAGRRLGLVWGVHAVVGDFIHSVDDIGDVAVQAAVDSGIGKRRPGPRHHRRHALRQSGIHQYGAGGLDRRRDQGKLGQRGQLTQQKSRPERRLFSYRSANGPMKTGLALTCLEAGVFLVNQIDTSLALDDLAVFVARLGRAQRIADFHGRFLKELNGPRTMPGRKRGGYIANLDRAGRKRGRLSGQQNLQSLEVALDPGNVSLEFIARHPRLAKHGQQHLGPALFRITRIGTEISEAGAHINGVIHHAKWITIRELDTHESIRTFSHPTVAFFPKRGFGEAKAHLGKTSGRQMAS